MVKYEYRAQEQRVPILIGEGHDFMVKIKVFPLATQREMVEDQMSQIHPAVTSRKEHINWMVIFQTTESYFK